MQEMAAAEAVADVAPPAQESWSAAPPLIEMAAPTAPAAPTPATPMPVVEARPPEPRSPRASGASLIGRDTPADELPSMRTVPDPPLSAAPEGLMDLEFAVPEAPAAAEPEPFAADAIDFGEIDVTGHAEPVAEPQGTPLTPDSSFGFDVDLDAAADLPMAADTMDEKTPDFGEVEIAHESSFSAHNDAAAAQLFTDPHAPLELVHDDTFELEPPPNRDNIDLAVPAEEMAEALPQESMAEPVPEFVDEGAMLVDEPLVDEPLVDEPLVDDMIVAEVPADLPSVLEYVDELPSLPIVTPPVIAAELLNEFEIEAPAEDAPPAAESAPFVSQRTSAPIDAFELIGDDAPVEPTPELTPSDGVDPIAPTATPAAEVFVTETMAELYVRQGLRQEAIAVYRQLISARPDDDGLRDRLRDLENGARKSRSTARAFFANLAGRRATPMRAQPVVEASALPALAEPDQEAGVALGDAPAADDAPVPAAPEPVAAARGTLDALFGHSEVAAPDSSAAHALAAAFAGVPPTIPGRPTRAASDEVSLDRVFREGAATPPRGGLAVPRQSTALKFDQFFAPTADPGAAPPPDAPASGAAPAGSESEQFQSWLTGLKKPS
jgi:hypothetical protein